MFTVLTNKKIAQNVYEMTLAGDTSGIKNAGQFVNVKIDGLFLRRPISVCDYGENFLKIIYKVVVSFPANSEHKKKKIHFVRYGQRLPNTPPDLESRSVSSRSIAMKVICVPLRRKSCALSNA